MQNNNEKIKTLFTHQVTQETIDEIEHDKFLEKALALLPQFSLFAMSSLGICFYFLPHHLQNIAPAFLSSNVIIWFLGLNFYPRKKVIEQHSVWVKSHEMSVGQKIETFCESILGKNEYNETNSIIYYVLISSFFKPLDVNLSLSKMEYEESEYFIPTHIKESFFNFQDMTTYCDNLLINLDKLNQDKKNKIKNTISEYFGLGKAFSIAILTNNIFLFKILMALNQEKIVIDLDLFSLATDNNYSEIYFNHHSNLEQGFIYHQLIKQFDNKKEYEAIFQFFKKVKSKTPIIFHSNSSSYDEFNLRINELSTYSSKKSKTVLKEHNLKEIPIKKKHYVYKETPKEKIYSFEEFKLMKFKLLFKIKENLKKINSNPDFYSLNKILGDILFIIEAMEEEHFIQINENFNLIKYCDITIPSLIDDKLEKENLINPQMEYQYHEQIKVLHDLIIDAKNIIFNYSYEDIQKEAKILVSMIDEMQTLIKENEQYVSYEKFNFCLNELNFILKNINANYYNKIKSHFNLGYLIKFYFPKLIEDYIFTSFKKQSLFDLTYEVDALYEKMSLLHEIIVNDAASEYQQNATILFNKFAEYNFTYLKANA